MQQQFVVMHANQVYLLFIFFSYQNTELNLQMEGDLSLFYEKMQI